MRAVLARPGLPAKSRGLKEKGSDAVGSGEQSPSHGRDTMSWDGAAGSETAPGLLGVSDGKYHRLMEHSWDCLIRKTGFRAVNLWS